MTYTAEPFDVAVIGAGHAGIEAALAAARLGAKTVCFTINADSVGNLPCNPSIGGTAKGVLVREIDALGGEMARAADACCIQFRMLGRSKGPAVRSPRAQADRAAYHLYMKNVLENTSNLSLKQAEIVRLHTAGGRVAAVETSLGAVHAVNAVVIASGTYLGGRVVVGDHTRDSGPDGLFAAVELTKTLAAEGIPLRRFKTGTPPRVLARSLDFDKMIPQPGETDVAPFSYETPALPPNRAVCHLTYTNERTHEIIRRNLHRSPLFSGFIEGIGPRYCPSIEDKIVRFADKDRHPVFVEPCGMSTGEMYLQGLSSSLPEDVQLEIVHSVYGLEHAEFLRPAYAIEYDCADPLDFTASLESKTLDGLFGAGQFIGTSGYEEAGALGLIAGTNAALKVLRRNAMTLTRSDSYVGVLIDDLVTKGTAEPYRMMTSRAEHRLILRQDNADERLCPLAASVGLIPQERLECVNQKYQQVETEISRLATTVPTKPPEYTMFHVKHGNKSQLYSNNEADTESASDEQQAPAPALPPTLELLLRRPEHTYESTAQYDPNRTPLPPDVTKQVEIRVKYAGYIGRAQSEASAARRAENVRLNPNLPYTDMHGIRLEARQKLLAVRPASIGQAMRISGVNPADIAALLIWLEKDKS